MRTDIPEGWHNQKISDFAEVVSGSTPDTTNARYWNGEIVWITPDDLSRNERVYINDSERKISKIGLENSSAKIIPNGSLVMSSRAPIGYLAIATSEFTTNQGCKSLRILDSSVSEFIYYSILLNMDKIKEKGEGTTFLEISKKDFERVILLMPESSAEQRKIADILLNADSAICKTKELIEKNKKMKRGLMTDLFNSRNLCGKKQRLCDCCIFIHDGTHFSFEDYENGIPLLSAKDVIEGQVIQDNNPRRISWKDYYSIHSKYELQEGDVVLTIVGTIGRSAVLKKITEKFTFQRSVAILRPRTGINSFYLYYYINTWQFQKSLKLAVNASAQGGVYLGALNNMPIMVPYDQKVQTTIVSILSSIDKKIAAEQQYLCKLIRVKSGLMHDLLTGRVRVAV